MKKLYSLFVVLISLLYFTSCEDDYTYSAPEALNITKADLYFTSAGGTGTVEVKTVHELLVTPSVDWCTVSVSGGVVTVKALENPSIESRAGTITIDDGVLTSLLAVYQEGLSYAVDMSNLTTLNSNAVGSTFVVIDSSSPYAVAYATSWLNYTIGEEGKVSFKLTENETGDPRGGIKSLFLSI